MKKIRFISAILLFSVFLFCSCHKSSSNNNSSISRNDNQEFKKIVCLSPSGAEILYAIGAEQLIAGRSDFCNKPESILEKTSVGGFDGATVSIEKIIALKADLVYGSAEMHEALVQPLNAAGIQVYLSKASSIDSIFDEIKDAGNFCGKKDEARKLADDMKQKLEKIRFQNEGKTRSKVYFEIWNSPLITCGKNSFINEVIEAAGGENVFGNLEQAYPEVSDETVIASNPDVIITTDAVPERKEEISKRTGWENIAAVKAGKIYMLDADLMSRPGPGIVEAVQEISEVIH